MFANTVYCDRGRGIEDVSDIGCSRIFVLDLNDLRHNLKYKHRYRYKLNMCPSDTVWLFLQ